MRMEDARTVDCAVCGKWPTAPCYSVLVGGANGDLDLLELIDGRSCVLQCRSASEIWEAETVWARVHQLNDRDQTAPRAIPIAPPHQNCVVWPYPAYWYLAPNESTPPPKKRAEIMGRLTVGPDTCCSPPRYRVPFSLADEGSKCV